MRILCIYRRMLWGRLSGGSSINTFNIRVRRDVSGMRGAGCPSLPSAVKVPSLTWTSCRPLTCTGCGTSTCWPPSHTAGTCRPRRWGGSSTIGLSSLWVARPQIWGGKQKRSGWSSSRGNHSTSRRPLVRQSSPPHLHTIYCRPPADRESSITRLYSHTSVSLYIVFELVVIFASLWWERAFML